MALVRPPVQNQRVSPGVYRSPQGQLIRQQTSAPAQVQQARQVIPPRPPVNVAPPAPPGPQPFAPVEQPGGGFMPPRQGPQPSVPQMQDQVQMQQDQAQIGNYQPQQQMTGGPQAVAPQNQQNMANGLANAMKQGPSASGYNPQGSAAGFQKVQGGQMGGSAMRNPSQNMAYARRNARRY